MEHRKLSDRSILGAGMAGRYALSVVASSALLTAGCANMTSTAPSVVANGMAAKVSGMVHGGSQPVVGSVVKLYYAGQSGFRSAATLAATTSTASDGSFGFTKDPTAGNSYPSSGSTFSCPTGIGDPQVYVIAKGGNTVDAISGYNNTAAAFLAGLGSCSSITASTFVHINEVTTVATLAAVQQYMDPISESIGADGILPSYNGLANAFNLASSILVNLTNGTARGAASQTGASVTVTATPETAKINHIANILASCINNAIANNPSCVTILNNALPPNLATTGGNPSSMASGSATLPPPSDVLQAALYMLTNPTDGSASNLQSLYNLAPAVGAPYQPTLTVVPTDWTIGVSYASTGAACAGGGSFIQNANQLNIDVSGDLWISNGQGNLAELSPSGIPLACQTISGGGSAGSTIDINGNVWIAAYNTNNIYRYTPGSGNLLTYTTPFAPIGLTADGSGNLFFTTFSSSGLYILPNAANDTSGSQATPTLISTTVGSQPFQLMPDQNGNVLVSSYSNFISQVAVNAATPASSITTPFTVPTPSYGIAITAIHNGNNYVYTAAANMTNNLTFLTGSGTSFSISNGFPTAAGAGGLNTPLGISIDGAQNVWVANNQTSSGIGSVSEISASGVALSPSTGFQKAASYLGANRSIAIDQSGNVWVGQDNSSTVAEILGAGIPLYQPYSLGLHNGRFQTIP